MFITLQRTSETPTIHQVLDFATGLTNARGDLITQGNGVAGFLAALTQAVEFTLEKSAPRATRPATS
jgi:N-methylhydantoinase B